MQSLKKNQTGFTLIELLVSIFIFSLVIMVGTSIFLSGFRAQRRALQTGELLNQMSYAVEYMSRALRMARKDDLGGVDCLTGLKVNYEITRAGRGIKFRNYRDECQEFFWEDNKLREGRNGIVSDLTSDDLEIIVFRAGPLDSWDQDDQQQPRLTLALEVRPKDQDLLRLRIQITISQRALDVPF